MVESAVSLFTGTRLDEREVLGVTLSGLPVETVRVNDRRVLAPSTLKGFELHGDPREGLRRDRELIEGPRWRVMVSPGTVAVRFSDPARAERAAERQERAKLAGQDADARRRLAGLPELPATGSRVVTSWSRRSRSRMVETLAALDWSAMFTSDELPAMVTLTYPGDWLAVAPNAAECRRHLLLLRKRYERAWNRRLVGVWKREFQRRGAPHWHLLMVPPHGQVDGMGFREWLSLTWAQIVGAARCQGVECVNGARCEYHRHVLAGTGVDYAEGVKARDPRSVGVYFAKHGAFADKEYQNAAPAEWLDAGGSVGRFWGVWGLERATAAVEVSAREAIAAKRTLRRLSRANAYVARVPVWRYRTYVDGDGQTRAKWRRSTKLTRVYRVKGQAGYLVVKDGPGVASGIARHLDQLVRPQSVMGPSGAGPVGFLP